METIDIAGLPLAPTAEDPDKLQMLRDFGGMRNKKASITDKSSIKSLRAEESKLLSRRIRQATPKQVTSDTVGSVLFGCVYPQSKDIVSECIPECLDGVKLESTPVCMYPVYSVPLNGKIQRVNVGSGTEAQIYISSKDTSLSDKQVSLLEKDGMESYSVYARKGEDISYSKIATHTIKCSTDTTKVKTKTKSHDCDESEAEKSCSSSVEKSVSFSDDVSDNEGKTKRCNMRPRKSKSKTKEDSKESSSWGLVAIIFIIIILLIIVISCFCCYYWYSGKSKSTPVAATYTNELQSPSETILQ